MSEPSSDASEREIFLAALKIDAPVERAEYLHQACGGNAALLQKIEALLQNLPGDSFLEAPAADSIETVVQAPAPEEQAGTVIGRYKLLERLGEGGFGTVWAAEQREPVRRRVALKIIKLGMDTKQVVGRFEAERQALALMDHPNIAKVLDAGSMENGRPFFVMELVRGIPITQYCDQESVGTRERIDLFIKVCHALQHAHQKGIIHRDIKPSNILVTLHDGVPVPKVIDFGIAKATQQDLTDKTIYTQFQQFIGTPAYMSPEQAEMSGLDIDTRSDVYSLGVLLYELLTGATPFDAKELAQSGVDAMRKIIREQEPVRPSTKLSQSLHTGSIRASHSAGQEKDTIAALRGDLDWIVMKCLEKDRSRRYETANGLALDLNRHLKHEPVLACPPSALYRFQKAWRRNKVVYSAVAAVAASLIIGLSVSVQRTAEAKTAREREAEQREAAESNASRATQEAERAKAAEAHAEKQAEEFRHMAYAADMNQAQRAQELGNLGEALAYLNRHRPEPGQKDIRGWEWRYLRGLCQSESLYKLSTVDARFFRLAVTTDGHWLFTYPFAFYTDFELAGFNPVIFDLQTRKNGRPEWLPEGNMVLGLASAHPLVATASETDEAIPTVRLLNYQTGQSRILAMPNMPLLARFSGDGGTLTTVHHLEQNTNRARFKLFSWNTETGEREAELDIGHTSPREVPELSETFALSPDGARYTRCKEDERTTLQLRAIATGEVVWEAPTEDGILGMVAFTPDGSLVISTPNQRSGQMKVWNANTGELLVTLRGHRAHVTSMNFTDDGRTLISTSADHTIRLWDLETGEPLGMLRGHNEEVRAGITHPDGKTFFSGSYDGEILAWRLSFAGRSSQHQTIQRLGVRGRRTVWRWAYSADGQSIVAIHNDRHLYRHSGRAFQLHQRITDSPLEDSHIHFGPTASVAVANDPNDNLVRLDFPDDSVQRRVLGDFKGRRPILVDPTKDLVVLANDDDDRTALLIDLEDGSVKGRILIPEPGGGRGVSADGEWLVTRSEDQSTPVQLLNTADPAGLPVALGSGVRYFIDASFNPRQELVAVAREPHLTEVYSTQSVELLHQFNGHLNGAKVVSFTPDGSRLVTGVSGDDAFKFWELREDRPLQLLTLRVDAMFQFDIQFSPDGNSMSSVDQLGTIHIWRAPSWEEIEAMEAQGGL